MTIDNPRDESNAERLRRYRIEAVKNGRCYTCRARPVRVGTRYCDNCIQATADYKTSVAYRKCTRCGRKPERRNLLCDSCRIKASFEQQRIYDLRFRDGRCKRCGKRSLEPGYAQCAECLDDQKDSAIARGRLAGAQPRNACSTCKALGIESTGHNRRTHDRWMERRKAWTP